MTRVSRNIRRAFILLAGLFPNLFSQPSDFTFEHLPNAPELANAVTTSIVQDSTGFIWIVTGNTLYRYDGYQVREFRGRDSTQLLNENINVLFVDRSGTLWVGTTNGLFQFNERVERFTRYRHEPGNLSSIAGSFINAIAQDAAGVMWFGTRGGLSRYDSKSRGFENYDSDADNPNSLSGNNVLSLQEDRNGTLWIGTHAGMVSLSKDRAMFHRYSQRNPLFMSLSSKGALKILLDSRGFLWIASLGDVLLCKPHGEELNPLGKVGTPCIDQYIVYDILEDKFGNLWFATSGGGISMISGTNAELMRIGRIGGVEVPAVQYRHVPLNTASLCHDNARVLFEDNSGALWVGTHGGISKTNNEGVRFVHYRKDASIRGGLISDLIGAVHIDREGTVWIGSDNGINKITPDSPNTLAHVEGNEYPTDIEMLFTDDGGDLWIASWRGLFVYNPRTRKISGYKHDPDNAASISSDVVMCIGQDDEGCMWFGTYGAGLNRLDKATGRFNHYFHDSTNAHTLSNNTVYSAYKSRKGDMWFGTRGGLNRFDKQTSTFARFFDEQDSVFGPSAVCPQLEDNDGNFWVGTNKGLYSFAIQDSSPDRIIAGRHYSAQEGLPGQVVSLAMDDNANIWMGTTDGISRLDRNTGRIRHFGPDDGCNVGLCSKRAAAKSRSGELFFGTYNGLMRFLPRNLQDNPYTPPVAFTSFSKFNRAVQLDSSISHRQAIVLDYDDKVFSFEFAGFNFFRPEKNGYAYMMQGFDPGWVYCGNKHEATYTNLDPGEYVFRVKASNNDGVWNEAGASLQVVILPPYWQTWWFRLFVVLTMSAIIYAAYRYRLSKLLEVERLRLRIASDLHDDIGSNLSSIALSSRLLLRDSSLSSQVRTQLDRIANTARHTADSMRDVVWMINPENDELDDMVLRMKDIAANLLQDIPYTFSAPKDGLSNSIGLEVKRNVFLVYKETLNNIVRHARATTVGIEVVNTGSSMVIKIRDNGVGFDAGTATNGNGLKSLQRRVDAINGTLTVVSKPGKGTQVTVSFNSRKGVMDKG